MEPRASTFQKGSLLKQREDIDMTIKEARKEVGLTQVQISKKTGIPLDTLKKWEVGNRTPPEWCKRLVIEKILSFK